MSTEAKVKKASVLLRELLGFDLDLATTVGELPLSIKQWITISRALLTNPKVLILDELSAALDFELTERLFRKMRQIKKAGATILDRDTSDRRTHSHRRSSDCLARWRRCRMSGKGGNH